MANTIKLEIVTPDAGVFSDDVDMVTLPGVEGEMGIYPHHVPLMTQLVPGEMIVRKDGREDFSGGRGGICRNHRQQCEHLDRHGGSCRLHRRGKGRGGPAAS